VNLFEAYDDDIRELHEVLRTAVTEIPALVALRLKRAA